MKGFGSGAMPATRIEQWKGILREHFFEVAVASIYTFLFFLPCLFWIIWVAFSGLFVEDSIYNYLVIYGGICLGITLAGLGFAGGFYFFRKLLWNEGANVHLDFFKGIRKNGKDFAKIFFLLGLAYFALHVSSSFLNQMEKGWLPAALLGVEYVFFFLLLMISVFCMVEATIYQGSLAMFFKNGCKFLVGNILPNLGLFFILFLPFLLFEFVPNMTVRFVAILCYFPFYSGLFELSYFAYCLSLFDPYIHRTKYPEIYRKGLTNEDENHYK